MASVKIVLVAELSIVDGIEDEGHLPQLATQVERLLNEQDLTVTANGSTTTYVVDSVTVEPAAA
jgi:hypothetical protein